MSSGKTYCDDTKWREINERISRNEAFNVRSREDLNRINNQLSQIRATTEANIAAMVRRVQGSVEALNNSFNNNLIGISSQISDSLRNSANSFSAQFTGLHNQLGRINSTITDIDRRVNTIASTYNNVFQQLAAQEQTNRDRAALILNQLDALVAQMNELDPQRFCPGDYTVIIDRRENIRTDIDNGDYQAAIGTSQTSILDAARLLARLQILNNNFNARFAEVSDIAIGLRERFDRLAAESAALIDVDNSGYINEYDYDISFWSEGQFGSLRDGFNNLVDSLNQSQLTPAQLDAIADNLATISHNLDVCDANARGALAASLAVDDMRIRLIEALQQRGWNADDFGYNEGDVSQPYAVTMTTPTGGVAEILFEPISPASPGIAYEAFAPDGDEAENEAIRVDIENAIMESGVGITPPTRSNDCHLNTDPATFRNNQIQRHRQERLARRQNTQTNNPQTNQQGNH